MLWRREWEQAAECWSVGELQSAALNCIINAERAELEAERTWSCGETHRNAARSRSIFFCCFCFCFFKFL